MGVAPWVKVFSWRFWRKTAPLLFLICGLGFVRWSKGVFFSDAYAFITRPFWPGNAQRDWIQDGNQIELRTRIGLLEQDNQRLREMLLLDKSSGLNVTSAPVISRSPNGWWQQLELGKGRQNGIKIGNPVIGPGGLVGIVESTTPITSRVRLLTSPGSKIGVWVSRTKQHGLLLGIGTNRPQLHFLDKDTKALTGDVVSTSPASILLPPNLPVGVIQSLDTEVLLAPKASVQLTASPEAIDWVQVQIN